MCSCFNRCKITSSPRREREKEEQQQEEKERRKKEREEKRNEKEINAKHRKEKQRRLNVRKRLKRKLEKNQQDRKETHLMMAHPGHFQNERRSRRKVDYKPVRSHLMNVVCVSGFMKMTLTILLDI